MYKRNPFHNFSHASHVTQSVMKLMSAVVAPSELADDPDVDSTNNLSVDARLHKLTYGITSDPLVQYACAFSALIHDVSTVFLHTSSSTGCSI